MSLMEMQKTLFDPICADAERVFGMTRAAEAHLSLLEVLREYLVSLARIRDNRTVSADDAYAFMERYKYDLGALGNGAGSLFRSGAWEFVGWVKSSRVTNHGRVIRCWKLK